VRGHVALAGLAAAALNVFHALPGHAYCVARACDDTKPEYACQYDGYRCPISLSRPELYWPSRCVSYAFNADGSELYQIDFDTANAAAEQAFAHWLGADCGGGTPGVALMNVGPVECGRVEYNQTGNANVFLFADDEWEFGEAHRTIALTIIQFSTDSGEIFDADIALNSANMQFTTDPDDDSGFSLGSVLTHETGHFLGLAHSSVPGSIMASDYAATAGDLLTPDDVDGICALHPPDPEAANDDCTPRHGLSRRCGGRLPSASGGCSFGTEDRGSRFAWFSLALAAFAARRTRRNRRFGSARGERSNRAAFQR
jgi:hypothetical protein